MIHNCHSLCESAQRVRDSTASFDKADSAAGG
jgi:hypothetical protein